MPTAPIQIVVVGNQTAVRPLLAAHALRSQLGHVVHVVAMSCADAPAIHAATVLLQQVGLDAGLLVGCDVGDVPRDGDLLIATDLGTGQGKAQTPLRAPEGGYLLVWSGREPQDALQVQSTLAELTEQVASLQRSGMIDLLRRRRSQGTPAQHDKRPTDHAQECATGKPPLGRIKMPEIVGESAVIKQMLRRIGKLARHTGPVLVRGETGTGKELVAAAIHVQSQRAQQPFVAFNCALSGSELVESELFGHARGAYTGAQASRLGLFRTANGGTLFLDEIAELPIAVQSKLLRVLETRQVRAVGADKEVPVDVRVVAATHRDLLAGVREGWFREDLYHRLAVGIVQVPALRDRIEDLPLLTEHLLGQLRRETQREYESISSVIYDSWRAYHWPGNVRELRNLLYRAVMDASGTELPIGALVPDQLSAPRPTLRPHPRRGQRLLSVAQVADAPRQSGGNRSLAATTLGVSRATLHRFLQEHPALG